MYCVVELHGGAWEWGCEHVEGECLKPTQNLYPLTRAWQIIRECSSSVETQEQLQQQQNKLIG